MKTYQITIPRFEEGQSEAILQTYTFEMEDQAVLSILDGLEFIYQNLDPTLAFFHHAACRQAACAKCMVKANGKSILACKQKLIEGQIQVEPYGKTVIKDLISKQE